MKIDNEWIDKNGFLIPQPNSEHSDNGILFSAVALILGFQVDDYIESVKKCFLKPGLMGRWPSNNFDQTAWDDYLGAAVGSIYAKDTDVPRAILRYGMTHFFIYDTDGKLQGKDWLLRNIPIWGLMFSAAFPRLKVLSYPLLYLTQLFFKKPDLNDTSGIQLQWVFLKGCEKIGFKFEKLIEHEKIIKDAMKIYYHKDHPFNKEPQ